MFPDSKKMEEILRAFKADPSIPSGYKEKARSTYAGKTYVVIGGNHNFAVSFENGKYHFQIAGLAS